MTEPSSATKQCPECGHSQRAELTICRECGYHFAHATPKHPQEAVPPPVVRPGPAEPPATVEPKPLLLLARPLVLVLLAIVTLIVLFWPTITGFGRAADAETEHAMRDWLKNRGGPRQHEVRVDDGVCRIDFLTPLPVVDAVALAGDAAVRYSQFARSQGRDDLAVVEVYYVGNKLAFAKAVKGMLLRTRSATVIPVELMVPVAKPARPQGAVRSGWMVILLVWTLLALFALLLWRIMR